MEVYRIHMGKAKCAVDLGDGSERGEYVDQDYILAKMGRPHRSISLMYCYYPLDEGWPGRASGRTGRQHRRRTVQLHAGDPAARTGRFPDPDH